MELKINEIDCIYKKMNNNTQVIVHKNSNAVLAYASYEEYELVDLVRQAKSTIIDLGFKN